MAWNNARLSRKNETCADPLSSGLARFGAKRWSYAPRTFCLWTADVKFDVKPDQVQPLSEPPSGKALVYVTGRTNTDRSRSGLTRWVVDSSKSWQQLFLFSVLPGNYHLNSLAKFTAEAGKIYYFRTRI
jgi:hypothetical protein